ncbi:MAG: GNAT family N-acetyltransferase [Roseococcus sp.]|nr:GNAT family N-acetyltransferase [Roseococcus sp.]
MAWRDARREDLPEVFRLLRALAEYERLLHEFTATEADYAAALFGPSPAAQAMLAEAEGRAVGVCLWYRVFPSFTGKPGIWIEDVFVEPAHRRRGLGSAVFRLLARRVLAEGGAALEWNVLDWNAPAIAAYRAMGAVPREQWTDMRVSGEALRALAERG